MPDQPQVTVLNIALYSSLVSSHARLLFGSRNALIVRLYAGSTGDEPHPGETADAARARYFAGVHGEGVAMPNDVRQIENRSIAFQRLQGAWMLLWIVALPALYPAYTLYRAVTNPTPWTPVTLIAVPLFVLFITTITAIIGLIIHSVLHRPFTRLCSRLLGIPEVIEIK